MIQAVIFDLDGTLVDSFEDIAAATNHALMEMGKDPLELDEIKSHVGHGLRNLLKGLLPDETEEQIDTAVASVKEYYAEHPTVYSKVYPGAIEMLESLSRSGIRTAVLSNKVDSLVQSIAERLGFADKMDAVWGHREEFPLKPEPDSLLEILSEFGVAPSDCLMVGDASPDHLLAENAGTLFCGVTYGMTNRSEWETAGVKWIVDSLGEIPMLVTECAPSID